MPSRPKLAPISSGAGVGEPNRDRRRKGRKLKGRSAASDARSVQSLIEKVTHVSRKANQKHTLDVSSAVLVKKPVAKPHDEPGCNNDDESVMSFLTLDSSRSIGMSTYRSIVPGFGRA